MSTTRPRVLIVEDYDLMMRALTRLLTPECEIVSVLAEGRRAIDAAEQLKPDVLLIDLNLPDMSGLDVCRAVRQANDQAKVILISGLADQTIEALAREAGATAFVSKAAAGTELLAAVQNAVSPGE